MNSVKDLLGMIATEAAEDGLKESLEQPPAENEAGIQLAINLKLRERKKRDVAFGIIVGLIIGLTAIGAMALIALSIYYHYIQPSI